MSKHNIISRCIPLLCLAVALVSGCDLQQATNRSAGQLRVVTYPEGAAVECNGVPYDISPATIQGLAPGSHLVVVSKKGYREMRQTVTLIEGQTGKVVEMSLEPEQGLVLVHAEPEITDVEIDGAYVGKTPLLLTDIALGNHRMKFKAEGYFDKEMELSVNDRTPQKVDVTLVSDSADITFASNPPGAQVDVGGIRRGKTPITVSRIPSGMVDVSVSLDGYDTYRETIKLNPGDEYEINADLQAIPGTMTIESVPSGARVYVENQFLGTTPYQSKRMKPGPYRVRVELKGFEIDARTVTVQNAEKTVEEFRLLKNSGILQLSTQPAGVEVFVDGERVGVTRSGASDVVSEPLQVDLLSKGSHRLQLTKKGYSNKVRMFTVEADKVTTLQEKLTRMFIPNYQVRTGEGADHIHRGVLIRKHPNGDISLEISPGIFRTFPKAEIVSSEPYNTKSTE